MWLTCCTCGWRVLQEEEEPEPTPTDILGPSPEVAAALAAAATAPAVPAEPADDGALDPWSALQAQYRPPSGETGAPASAGSGHRSSSPGGRAGRSPGSKRTTKEEMVLVDGTDGSGDEGAVVEGSKKKGRGKPAGGSAGPVKGGWGAGDLAAAGTIMTGAEEEEAAAAAAAAAKDGVFDESEDEGARGKGHSAGGAGKAAAHGKSSGAEVLGMEEVEDLDESAAAEMAAAGAMSKDLAAKLAQFEAMEADE